MAKPPSPLPIEKNQWFRGDVTNFRGEMFQLKEDIQFRSYDLKQSGFFVLSL